MILSYAQRQAYWNWCRDFIDHEVIYRADDTHPEIPGKAGGTYVWQFYLRRASFNPHFAHALGLLFWDLFLDRYAQQPFQICAPEPSGPPIAAAIAAAAAGLKIPLNVFHARREPKSFGIDNWFDGKVNKLPVLMVDDIAASAPFMLLASLRVQQKLELPLYHQYFALVNKVGRGVAKKAQHTENLLAGQLVALFNLNNFHKKAVDYVAYYGNSPQWRGLVA